MVASRCLPVIPGRQYTTDKKGAVAAVRKKVTRWSHARREKF